MSAAIVFSVIAVLGAIMAVAFSDTRKVVFASWLTGMSMGALFLACGAEYLAIVQWMIATLAAISLLIFATMYGEYGSVDERTLKEKLFDALPAVVVGAAFFAMLWLAVRGLSAPAVAPVGPTPPSDLGGIGQALGERHLVALELTGFMLLAVLIGAGVLARAENSEDSDPDWWKKMEGQS